MMWCLEGLYETTSVLKNIEGVISYNSKQICERIFAMK